MRILLTFLAVFFYGAVNAEDYLYSHDDAGINIGKSNGLRSIRSDGNYLSFNVDTNQFMLTSLLLEHLSSEPYPVPEKMNALLFQVNDKRHEDLKLTEKVRVNVQFENRKIMGSLYKTEYFGSSMRLCDINIVHPVRNKYYLHLTLTASVFECEKNYDDLMKALRTVYMGIQTNGV